MSPAHGPSVREPCRCARSEHGKNDHGKNGCGQNDRSTCGCATVGRATVGRATVGGMTVGCTWTVLLQLVDPACSRDPGLERMYQADI